LKHLFFFLFIISSVTSFSQGKLVHIEYSGVTTFDEEKYPGATILTKDANRLVEIHHDGAILTCMRAIVFKKKNLFTAFGTVLIKQGDTITQTSDYVDYNGNTKMMLSKGNVVLRDPKMTLTTDTLNFDRQLQLLFYKHNAVIKDETNTLKSKVGTYFLKEKKFVATTKVLVTNPEHVLESNHLDYYTDSSYAYLYGPSTITGKDNIIYTERGFYNTKAEISHFVKNATIYFKDRTIKGDSLYYDRFKGFASATKNIKVTDTVQNFVAKGNYAEFFEKKDSVFIIDRAVAISILEKDSLYIHGDTLLVTGKASNRIVRIYNDVKIFKSDLQGKSDSIYMNQTTGLTKMYTNPILWSGKNQITGDSIHLLNNKKTDKLDSLKVLNNALIVQLDTIIDGVSTYNQIKGRNMYGKFIDGKLKHFLVEGNAEMVYYNRSEEGILETITKQECSSIEFTLDDTNNIESVTYIKKPEGTSYPPKDLPITERRLRGFIWREDEQPKTMEAIFGDDKKIPEAIIDAKKLSLKKKKKLVFKKVKR
jgi:lipopolysaccharide export system protein LptA